MMRRREEIIQQYIEQAREGAWMHQMARDQQENLFWGPRKG
jgi:hypothetical protein